MNVKIMLGGESTKEWMGKMGFKDNGVEYEG